MLFTENRLWRSTVGFFTVFILAATLVIPALAMGYLDGPVPETKVDRERQVLGGDFPLADLAVKGLVTPSPRVTLTPKGIPKSRVTPASQPARALKAVPSPKPASEVRLAQTASRGEYRIHLRPGDLDLLARLVQAEAGGEPYIGKVAVAAVVINRVQSNRFPDTVREVIFEQDAFEPVSNGWIWNPPSPSAYRAVLAALRGWDPSGGALYFFAPAKTNDGFVWSRQFITRIGNHIFAR